MESFYSLDSIPHKGKSLYLKLIKIREREINKSKELKYQLCGLHRYSFLKYYPIEISKQLIVDVSFDMVGKFFSIISSLRWCEGENDDYFRNLNKEFKDFLKYKKKSKFYGYSVDLNTNITYQFNIEDMILDPKELLILTRVDEDEIDGILKKLKENYK